MSRPQGDASPCPYAVSSGAAGPDLLGRRTRACQAKCHEVDIAPGEDAELHGLHVECRKFALELGRRHAVLLHRPVRVDDDHETVRLYAFAQMPEEGIGTGYLVVHV